MRLEVSSRARWTPRRTTIGGRGAEEEETGRITWERGFGARVCDRLERKGCLVSRPHRLRREARPPADGFGPLLGVGKGEK